MATVNETYKILRLSSVMHRSARSGPTNDPGAGCKMCKILAYFPVRYHGNVAPGYHGIFFQYGGLQLPSFSIFFDQEIRQSVRIRSRLSGEICSWCPSSFLGINGRNSRMFVRPFSSYDKRFSGRLSLTYNSIPGDLSNEFCLLFFLFSSLKHFFALAVVWPHIIPIVPATRSPDGIFLACLPIHQVCRTCTRALRLHSIRKLKLQPFRSCAGWISRYVAATEQRNRPITNNVLLNRSLNHSAQ